MVLQSLGYVGIASARLDEWTHLASRVLGMQVADSSRRTTAFRMDDHRQRLVIDGSGEPGYFGWEAGSAACLDELANRLDAAGVPYTAMTESERAQRFVADGIVFRDPVGNRLEVFRTAAIAGDPFVPGREISGFRTGPLGLGHAVLTARDAEPMVRFYRDLLGFALSDFCHRPFKAFFFHLNPRHHSLAIVETGTVGIHHLMVEMQGIDDVGQAYDLASELTDGINVTLGRHSNDHMFSFYANTPADVLIECGWGGRLIEPTGWVAEELTIGPSLWGHERSWLPEDKREEARRMRAHAAAAGCRAPVHVHGDNYDAADPP